MPASRLALCLRQKLDLIGMTSVGLDYDDEPER